jgi:AcrR family transcriptional regulator
MIPAETRSHILNVAWAAIADAQTIDMSMSEMARRAGVSRQTMYLAFENRAGLLEAMVANKDETSPLVGAISAARESCDGSGEALLNFNRAWLAYLPEIYPVGSLLSAASIGDPAAATAWQSRMTRLRQGMFYVTKKTEAHGNLQPTLNASKAADICYSLAHVENWRLLVVECSWSPEEFVQSRLELIERTVLHQSTVNAASL